MDDKFSKHVKSVFDDYEDGTADQGWTELLKKYPDQGLGGAVKPQKHAPIRLWMGAAAASILLACFILFFANEQSDKAQLAGTKSPVPPELKTGDAALVEMPADTAAIAGTTRSAGADKPELEQSAVVNMEAIGQQAAAQTYPVRQIPVGQQKPSAHQDPAVQQAPIGQQAPVAQQIPKENTAVAFKPTEEEKKPVSVEEFLEQETRKATALASNEKKSKPLTSFDIYAGTFLNYFEDNPAKMNAGFGVNANVRLAKKVYLSVGAGISENTIAYENSFPSASVEALTSSFPLNQPNSLKSPNKPSAGGTQGAIGPASPDLNVTFASKTSGPSTDVSVNAILLNLDVPIALKFYAGKNDRFYLLTGINSNSYINQRYMQSYSTFNYVSNTTEVMEQEVEGSRLSGFDFANSAVFAVGVSQDLSKSTTLTFEPFYRPSLKGLGDKNIRINTIGVNLKLNLKGANK